jgi:hypothetical protein
MAGSVSGNLISNRSFEPVFGAGLGIATGLLVGAAVASNSYYYAPGYRDCRYVERYDRWGNLRTIRVCDVARIDLKNGSWTRLDIPDPGGLLFGARISPSF